MGEATGKAPGEVIPLFPLATPLFPGIVLPLEIFEPRYRRLVRDLMALPEGSDRRFFGVTAIRQGWEVERVAPAAALYDIGCTARLQAVGPRSDGGFRIVTVGADRFRLLQVLVGEEPPYLQADVDWLVEQEDADGAGQVRELFTEYVATVAALQGATAPDAGAETEHLLRDAGDDPRALSWLVASAALLSTDDRQALLTEPATRSRLAAESRLLRRELTLLRALQAVPAPLQQFAVPMAVN
jgi:Lon protease-like protein